MGWTLELRRRRRRRRPLSLRPHAIPDGEVKDLLELLLGQRGALDVGLGAEFHGQSLCHRVVHGALPPGREIEEAFDVVAQVAGAADKDEGGRDGRRGRVGVTGGKRRRRGAAESVGCGSCRGVQGKAVGGELGKPAVTEGPQSLWLDYGEAEDHYVHVRVGDGAQRLDTGLQ